MSLKVIFVLYHSVTTLYIRLDDYIRLCLVMQVSSNKCQINCFSLRTHYISIDRIDQYLARKTFNHACWRRRDTPYLFSSCKSRWGDRNEYRWLGCRTWHGTCHCESISQDARSLPPRRRKTSAAATISLSICIIALAFPLTYFSRSNFR